MKIIFSIYDYLREKIKKKVHFQLPELTLFYCIGLGIAFVLIMLPLFYASFFNAIFVSDDFGHAMNVHKAWVSSPSIYGFFKAIQAAYERMVGIYLTWGGNYTSFFFSSFNPIAFSEKLNFVGTFTFLGCFLWAQYRFLNEVMCRWFNITKRIFLIAYFSIAILETQWLTSIREAFFWYSSGTTNPLGFAGSLAILRIILQTVRLRKMERKTFVWGIFLAIFVGGCNYSSMMSMFIILFFLLLDLFGNKELNKKEKTKIFFICIVFYVGSMISIMAPGNALRQMCNDGTDAVHAILLSIVLGKQMLLQYMDYKIILWTVLLFPLLWNCIDQEKEYKYPLLVIIISVGIFMAAFTPTAKSDSYFGPRRTRNLYWWIFLNLYIANLMYIIGWLKKKIKKNFIFNKNHCWIFLIGMGVVAALFMKIQDIKAMPSVVTACEIKSGKYTKFGSMLKERNVAYNSSDRCITVKKIDYLPYVIFDEEDLFANEVGETVSSDYFDKDKIYVIEED